MQWQDVDCIEISSESEPEPPKTLDELFNECTDEFNVASRRLDEAMITALLPPSYRSNSHIEPRTSSFGARNMNNGHITRKLTPEQLHDNLVFPHRNGKLNKPLSSMKFTQGTDFRSHSKYESNLPTSSVILDSPTNESVSFLPYADKSGSYRSAIDDLLYTDLHDGILHWSNEAYHSFENDVDNERVLIECASRARDSGLEIPMDTVPWTLLEKADQRSSLASPVTDQVTSLTNGVRYFCWNINCLCGCCLSHKLPRQPSPTTHSPSPHDDSRAGTHRSVAQETNDPTTNPHLKTAFYERTQAQMLDFDYRRSTCVTPCCLPAKPLPIQNDGSWGQEDEEYLKMLLLSNPDMRPCPASMVTKVPCARVFDIRGEMIQEQQLVPKPTILAKRRKQAQRAGYKPTKKTILARTGPCRHEGPCDGSVSCSCYKNGHYCQRGCGCAGSCMRSWRPCRCTGESKRIKELKNTEESEKTNDRCSGKCPCKKADRECDPLMCTCGARQSGSLRILGSTRRHGSVL
ncbi:hypothetical protein BDV98DRAFT_201796 [Pterulicium gracile]|uniref:CXC domain-containing protein n=1 Tax=Pterulicium gracile TaxID=1884261 RepID=A0A5C3QAA2_9AGAR|nr:hypothetical protein BDV98DRAFT_201796 [Pterula gracilis]